MAGEGPAGIPTPTPPKYPSPTDGDAVTPRKQQQHLYAANSLTPSHPTTSPPKKASPATTLPKIETPPDERFLNYDAAIAGRAVVIELYAPPDASADHKRFVWGTFESLVSLPNLGKAAQRLERAGYNWRQAQTCWNILKKAAELLEATNSN